MQPRLSAATTTSSRRASNTHRAIWKTTRSSAATHSRLRDTRYANDPAHWVVPCFAERFIRGREFNLSVLSGPAEPEVLSPAEIDFSAFPAGKAHMVGYRAKWVEDSFEFANTPRRFEFPASDAQLLAQLERLARDTFQAMGLSGYARVDFRVDAEGPWILEVNTNPCISPDAGFAAALAQSGIRYRDAIARIVEAALS